MSRLSQHGGFSEEAIEKAKAQMAEGLEFAEQQETPARNRDGMPSIHGFAEQMFDFARCQRADGSYYGTSGVCRKGTKAGAKEKEAPKGKSSGSSAKGKTGTAERRMPKRASSIEAKRKRLGEEMRKINKKIKQAGQGGATKALRAKRARIEEAMNKLRYPKGTGQSKLTGADVKRAVGTAD